MIENKDEAISCLKLIAERLLKENRYVESHTALETLMYFYRKSN